MGMHTKRDSAERRTGIFGGNQLVMEQTKAKEYILYNEVTNEYLTRVTFMGSIVYKTTTLDLAMRFSEQDKEKPGGDGCRESGKGAEQHRSDGLRKRQRCEGNIQTLQPEFPVDQRLDAGRAGSLQSGNRRGQKESCQDPLLPDRQQIDSPRGSQQQSIKPVIIQDRAVGTFSGQVAQASPVKQIAADFE